MFTFPRLSENEMNYYQFKAKQLLQLRKEDQEWSNYCNQVIPECAACSTDQIESTSSKSVGIQVSQRKPTYPINNKSSAVGQKDKIPETLNNIIMKLENIDLALSKMYNDTSHEDIKNIKKQEVPVLLKIPAHMQKLTQFRDQRKLLIQNSIKNTLEKIHNLSTVKPRPRPIKNINSGYFIPHDLQVKRAAARKAYLASLKSHETKPKVLTKCTTTQAKNKIPQKNSLKKVPSKTTVKSRQTPESKTKVLHSNLVKQAEDTLIKSLSDDENKDDNIECVVDGILDDLLGEAAIDLNRIRQIKIDKQAKLNMKSLQDKVNLNKSPKRTVSFDQKESGIRRLKSYLEPFTTVQNECEIINKESNNHNTVLPDVQTFEPNHNDNSNRTYVKMVPSTKLSQMKISPKFSCGVSHIININAIEAKKISEARDKFWKYLRDTGRCAKGNFDPCMLCNVITESIIDECIQDVAEELSNLPDSLVKDLYNQEFIQQVE